MFAQRLIEHQRRRIALNGHDHGQATHRAVGFDDHAPAGRCGFENLRGVVQFDAFVFELHRIRGTDAPFRERIPENPVAHLQVHVQAVAAQVHRLHDQAIEGASFDAAHGIHQQQVSLLFEAIHLVVPHLFQKQVHERQQQPETEGHQEDGEALAGEKHMVVVGLLVYGFIGLWVYC